MPDAIITLTTDFGTDSPYVAALKGVLLGINPSARLVDLSHQIPPQDIRHAAYFLADSIPYFPAGALHVIVVDPGVGTERRLLYAEVAGQRLLAPDNGCWTLLPQAEQAQPLLHLTEARYWRQPVSATFQGRDILMPVAGHLSRGLSPANLGPPLTDWVRLMEPRPTRQAGCLMGEIVFVDHFGNLISNIPADACPTSACLRIGEHEVPGRVTTYGQASPGTLVALPSSTGRLEIAVVNGNAAARLQASVGACIRIEMNG